MKVTATKTFRPRSSKGDVVYRGTVMDVDDEYGQTLVRSGMAVANDSKSLKDYQNKMAADYEDKSMSVAVETPEQRSQGFIGSGPMSETPEERTQGYGAPGQQQQDAKVETVDIDPPTKEAGIDQGRRSFLEAETRKLVTEDQEKERRRLGRFRYQDKEPKLSQPTQFPVERQGQPTQLPAKDHKDQKNRDSR